MAAFSPSFEGASTVSNVNSDFLVAESVIKEGLVKAARDTKAWLFTSGVNHVSLE